MTAVCRRISRNDWFLTGLSPNEC